MKKNILIILIGVVLSIIGFWIFFDKDTQTKLFGKKEIIISEDQAPEYKKQEVSVDGVVQYNFNSGKQTVLSFHKHHKGYFKALIRSKYYPQFEDTPDIVYPIGTKVRIRGKLEWYQGDQTIFVTDSSQITILKDVR